MIRMKTAAQRCRSFLSLPNAAIDEPRNARITRNNRAKEHPNQAWLIHQGSV
jgi:hypothetical protein